MSDRTNAAARASKKRKYALVVGLKSGPCADCHRTFPAECMDFDHVRDVKAFSIMQSVNSRGLPTLLREIAKCEVVCSNCHRIRTTARRRALGLPTTR